MHQTTVRFGDDLRFAHERQAARFGVSVAHHARRSALACTDGAGNGGEAVCSLTGQRAAPEAR